MRRLILILACAAGLVAGSLTGAAAVLASGTNTSAGDNQYTDPLATTTTASHASTPPSASSSSGSSSSSSSSPSLSAAPSTLSSGSSSSTGSTGTASSAHGGTLPFTGMNVWACAAIGVGLLGAGLVLRRGVRAT